EIDVSLVNEPRPNLLGPPLAMSVSADTAPTPDDVVAFARDHEVALVDLKFTDLPGTWQHFAVAARELSEGLLPDGAGCDGSSIRVPGDQRVGHAARARPGDRAHRSVPRVPDALAGLRRARPDQRRVLLARPAVRRAQGAGPPEVDRDRRYGVFRP